SGSSGTPTGSVDFKIGSIDLGTVALSGGVAILTTTALPAGSDSVTAFYLGDFNYGISNGSKSVTVTPATLPVTANAASKVYGATLPSFGATITGFVNGDSPSVVSGSAALNTTATSSSGVGSYPITAKAGSLSAVNYTFAFIDGTLTITPATLTVTANAA